MATVTRIDLAGGSVAASVSRTIREARALVGWSQRELASRAGVSQATVWRAETGAAASLDMIVVGKLFAALALRSQLEVDDFRLDDRRRQQDVLHALLNGRSARCHERDGWVTALEVMIGGDVPHGWIDLLAFREADRALIVQETKTDIPDMGGLQCSLAFYERSAQAVAHGLGWDATSVTTRMRPSACGRSAAGRAGASDPDPASPVGYRDWDRRVCRATDWTQAGSPLASPHGSHRAGRVAGEHHVVP